MSNPFLKLPPLPSGTTGERGYDTAGKAKAAALAAGHKSFAVMGAPRGFKLANVAIQVGMEYAWMSPAQAYTVRAPQAQAAGIKCIELVSG